MDIDDGAKRRLDLASKFHEAACAKILAFAQRHGVGTNECALILMDVADPYGRDLARDLQPLTGIAPEDATKAEPDPTWETFVVALLLVKHLRAVDELAPHLLVDLPPEATRILVAASGDLAILPVNFKAPQGDA